MNYLRYLNSDRIAALFRSLLRFPSYLFSNLIDHEINGIVLISETHNWVVADINNTLKGLLSEVFDIYVDILPFFYSNKIIHYGSLHSITSLKHRFSGRNNKIIISVYHVDMSDSEFRSKMHFLQSIINDISLIIVPNMSLYSWFTSSNFPSNKIRLIPIAYDESSFVRYQKSFQDMYKLKYNIPIDKHVIGSFQKDGNDWGEGATPKYIKGPDVFVSVVKELSLDYDVCCLLTGPSRGYIISELKKNNIDYVYHNATKQQLPELYACLDLYLIASRIEGGPKGLMEAMAIGVPVVSTKVGMATDIVSHRYNGMIRDVEDVEGLADSIRELLSSDFLVDKIVDNALVDVKQYSWDKIIDNYEKIYQEQMFCE
jgi:glycosyltransferase involved in cell wall biosynthesis